MSVLILIQFVFGLLIMVRSRSPSPEEEEKLKRLGPSRVQQQFARECDINHIMAKYSQTGRLTDGSGTSPPMYGDFSDVKDFHEAQSVVLDANQKFSSLPSHVRFRFSNNPELLLNFLQDPSNLDEAIKLGLVDKNSRDLRSPPNVPSGGSNVSTETKVESD